MSTKQSFLDDKVFKIDINDNNASFFNLAQTYKYVHLKVKNFFDDEFLIQIIDISDRILYNDAKAEQGFLEMINGAVSHELRNPLNSMIG
jgi:signal transduction histidine kinase